MIGKNARSIRHLERSAEFKKPIKVLIISHNNVSFGSALKVKLQNGKNAVALFQNIGGDNERGLSKVSSEERDIVKSLLMSYQAFIIMSEEMLDRLGTIIILPNNFDELYESFCKNNRKLLDQVFGKYCYCHDNTPKMFYNLIGDKPNLFVWALTNYFKNHTSYYTLFHIIMWNENYNKLSNKLSKGTITAYNGNENIKRLEDEMNNIRRGKRANDSINIFNTFQKKALKTVELTPKVINILNKFGRLSKTKKINFVRKMSTVDSTEEILKSMSFLTNTQFEWDKESVIEYINNAENINADIIINEGPILLVKVNDYETIKHLARSTNWCISKNKKYWNDYIEFRDKANQYIIFDFSRREDDKLSIVGFTTNDNLEITNAHNFINDNLMCGDSYSNSTLTSFVPFTSNSIFSILKKDNISLNKIFKTNNDSYSWNKMSFMNFVNHCIYEENINLIHESDDKVCLIIKDENVRHLLNKGYKNVMGNDTTLFNVIIFADFEIEEYESNRLVWGIIIQDRTTHEEKCNAIYDINGRLLNETLDTYLDEFNLPYDTICRVYNENTLFIDNLNNLNINKLKTFFSNKEFIKKFISSKEYNHNSSALNALNDSIFRYKSFDFINLVYSYGYKLNNFINIRQLKHFISNLTSTIIDYYYENDEFIPKSTDYEEFYRGNMNPRLSTYIGYIEVLRNISNNENCTDVFKEAIYNYVPSDSKIGNLLLPIFANCVDLDTVTYQSRYLGLLASYECVEAIDIILSKSPSKQVISTMLDQCSNKFINEKLNKALEHLESKPNKEMSFSIS